MLYPSVIAQGRARKRHHRILNPRVFIDLGWLQCHNLEACGYGFGHYFNSLEEAEKDFEERIKNWGFKPQNDD